MDPLSQGVLGAALPQAIVKKDDLKAAGIFGFYGGLLADLDVLIRSNTDPILFLEFHRQFTHSLIFIPLGGLLGALFIWLILKRFLLFKSLGFAKLFLFVTLGYATHGFLDACTTYGTQLFWPFSNYRVAWNIVSIIDPLFTLPILGFVLTAAFKKKLWAGRLALIWALAYLGLGVMQNHRGVKAVHELATSRGHHPNRADAKPSLGNLVLWKLTYEFEGRFYVDAVHLWREPKFYQGESVEQFSLARDFPDLDPKSRQAQDIERFRWFSNDHLALKPGAPDVVADMRYSILPHQVNPLWGIRIRTDQPNQHVVYETYRDLKDRSLFFSMLIGANLK